MSDILKKISDTITETGKTVGEKTKQVGSAAKLSARVISSERSVSENYVAIGKYYYDNYKDNPDEEIAEAVNNVTAALDTIDQLRSKMLAIKGLVKCQKCGAECPFEDTYCGKCGVLLEKPEPEPEEEEEGEEAEVEAIEAADEEDPAEAEADDE